MLLVTFFFNVKKAPGFMTRQRSESKSRAAVRKNIGTPSRNGFFAVLEECYERGTVTRTIVEEQTRRDLLRHEAMGVIAGTSILDRRTLLAV